MAGLPNVDYELIEGEWVINDSKGHQGTGASAAQGLFDRVRGTWASSNSWYFVQVGDYVDITINQDSRIWGLGNSGYTSRFTHPLKVEVFEGGVWVDYLEIPPLQTISSWQPMVELPIGRYKISSILGSSHIWDEWFIENIEPPWTKKHLIKINNKIHTLSENMGVLTYPELTEPLTFEEYDEWGMDDLSGYEKPIEWVKRPMDEGEKVGEGRIARKTVDKNEFLINSLEVR